MRGAAIVGDEASIGSRRMWRPVMSRVEAEAWGAGSAYPAALYHATTVASAEAISREGFVARYVRFGRVWGNGVYATPDPAVAAYYEQFFTGASRTLELRARVGGVLTVFIDPRSWEPQLEQALAQIPGGMTRYQEIGIELLAAQPNVDPRPEAFTRLVHDAGYDALEIVEPRPTPAVGGIQVVVFGPRERLVVVDEPHRG